MKATSHAIKVDIFVHNRNSLSEHWLGLHGQIFQAIYARVVARRERRSYFARFELYLRHTLETYSISNKLGFFIRIPFDLVIKDVRNR